MLRTQIARYCVCNLQVNFSLVNLINHSKMQSNTFRYDYERNCAICSDQYHQSRLYQLYEKIYIYIYI